MFRYTRRDPHTIVAMASILMLGGVLPLAVAVVAQFGFGLHPCHFCLLERYPYLLVIACGIATVLLPRMSLGWRFAVALGVYALLADVILSLIHTGIERGLLHFDGGCVAQTGNDSSLEALRAQIVHAPIVACNEVAASVLHLSLASWNAVFAALVILLIFLQQRFEWRRFDH